MRKTIVACVATALIVGAGTATAQQLITSSDIKDGTIKGADIKNGTIKSEKIKKGTIKKDRLASQLQQKIDQPGPAGPKGALAPRASPGAKGDTGAQGPPGQSLVHYALTPPNPALPGSPNVVTNVPNVPLDSDAPLPAGTEAQQGVELFPPVQLAEGSYLISSTAQFFDFTNHASATAEYGVTTTWLCTSAELSSCEGTVAVATTWTPDIPDDANNGAQQSGSAVVDVPAGGRFLVSRSVVRGGDTGDLFYQAGANVIVTRLGG